LGCELVGDGEVDCGVTGLEQSVRFLDQREEHLEGLIGEEMASGKLPVEAMARFRALSRYIYII
jgi:hypothetical protein